MHRAYTAIVDTFRDLTGYDYEIIFTDNHSTDDTFEILKEIAGADRRVRVIRFSRNIGYQRSLLAAYKAATGDCSVQIDCDLQDPPHLIPGMLALWRQGNHVVYGVRRSLKDGWVTALVRRMFYRLVQGAQRGRPAPQRRRVPPRRSPHSRRVAQCRRYVALSARPDQRHGLPPGRFRVRSTGPRGRRKQVPVEGDVGACGRRHPQPLPDSAPAGFDHQRGCRER